MSRGTEEEAMPDQSPLGELGRAQLCLHPDLGHDFCIYISLPDVLSQVC